MTYVIVVFSVLIQGLTVGGLAAQAASVGKGQTEREGSA